jgi:Lipocalin-like domain
MSMNAKSWIVGLAMVAAGVATASAQTIKEQLVGTWTLVSLVEQYQDGRKETAPFGPNLKGQLMLDRTGRFSLQLIGERPKAAGNPRTPVGPAVAYFGTYSVGEGDKSLTYHVERATITAFEGTDQKATVTINGDDMSYVRAPIPSPEGTFVPTLTWKRVK